MLTLDHRERATILPRRSMRVLTLREFTGFVAMVAMIGVETGAQQPASSQPPVRSIADAIAQRATAAEATVAGRATASAGKLQSGAFDVAIEDGTGGIRLFSRAQQPDVREGDSLIATGTLKAYRGNLELVVGRLQIVPVPRRKIAPKDVTIDPAVMAAHSGRLVRVHGHTAGFGYSEGGQWLRLRDPSGASRAALTVWVPANHGATVDLSRAGGLDSVVIVGVMTAYQDNADDPVVWQLVPRDAADVELPNEAGDSAWLMWAALTTAIAVGAWLVIGRLGARRQLHALRETEARYRQLLALLPDAVIVHAGGRILFTNPATSELLGIAAGEELIGRALTDFVDPEFLAAFAEMSSGADTAPKERAPRARARMRSTSGTLVDVELASSPCVYHDRPAMVLLARDITAQLRYERDLHALALVDELTGLQNRRAFTLFAEQELARARRHGRTPVLVFADLDGLKLINDRHGHAAGDAALRLVAGALKSIFRETDVVARWSGDEFVALMVDGSEEAAQLISARLDAAIAVQSPQNLPYVVTASVGASPLDPALPLRDAMERADAELYAHKKRGRRSKKIRATPMGIDAIK